MEIMRRYKLGPHGIGPTKPSIIIHLMSQAGGLCFGNKQGTKCCERFLCKSHVAVVHDVEISGVQYQKGLSEFSENIPDVILE